eukprot:5747845-Prymnesium_polylepis.1
MSRRMDAWACRRRVAVCCDVIVRRRPVFDTLRDDCEMFSLYLSGHGHDSVPSARQAVDIGGRGGDCTPLIRHSL